MIRAAAALARVEAWADLDEQARRTVMAGHLAELAMFGPFRGPAEVRRVGGWVWVAVEYDR